MTTPSASSPTSSDPKNRHTPPVDGFCLGGVSNLPDPATHAFRKDLADTALAGRVIASHYAEPLVRHLIADSPFRVEADESAEVLADLRAGDEIRMLDCSRGWAWGYGPDGRVGYVAAGAIAP
jgi:hypothetical protein